MRCRLQSALDLCVQLFAVPWTVAARFFCPWTPGKNTGVSYHFLLYGIFLTQGSNPYLLCLLHWQVGSLSLHHLGSSTKTLKTLSAPLHRVSLLWACGLLTIAEESKPTPQIRGSPALAVPLSFGSKNKT